MTVNTVTISRQGGVTIELFGAKIAANDALSINGMGGNDTFYVTAVGISTSLQGNTVAAITISPITTFYYIGWQGAGAPGVLSGIDAALTIIGSNSIDTAEVDDSGDFNDASYVVTPNSVITNAVGPNGSIAYDSKLDNLVLLGGMGTNDITIKNTGAALQTTIHGGSGDDSFIVNGPISMPLAINGDGSLTGADALTINGTPNADKFVLTPTSVSGDGAAISFINIQSLLVMGGGGNDTFTLNGDAIPTTIQGAGGNDIFIINGISAPTTINGGPDPATVVGTGGIGSSGPNQGAAAGTDTFIINAAAAPLTVNGFNGTDTFTVNANASTTVVNGGAGQDTFTVNGNSASLTLNGGPLFNTFNINSNSAQLAINSGTGATTYNIASISSPITLNSSSSVGADTYHLVEPLFAPVTIAGGAVLQFLILDGTSGANVFTITTSSIQLLGAATITYSGAGDHDQRQGWQRHV